MMPSLAAPRSPIHLVKGRWRRCQSSCRDRDAGIKMLCDNRASPSARDFRPSEYRRDNRHAWCTSLPRPRFEPRTKISKHVLKHEHSAIVRTLLSVYFRHTASRHMLLVVFPNKTLTCSTSFSGRNFEGRASQLIECCDGLVELSTCKVGST